MNFTSSAVVFVLKDGFFIFFWDLSVKILREDKNCPGSTQLVKWYVDHTLTQQL